MPRYHYNIITSIGAYYKYPDRNNNMEIRLQTNTVTHDGHFGPAAQWELLLVFKVTTLQRYWIWAGSDSEGSCLDALLPKLFEVSPEGVGTLTPIYHNFQP